MKCQPKLLVFLIMMWSLILASWPLVAGVDYEITYDDPEGDIQVFDSGSGETKPVSGYEDIDILQIKSSRAALKQNLVLEMLVSGEIISSENVVYEFLLMDGDVSFYNIWYTNDSCFGFNTNSMSSEPDILVATGEGTDTLTVTVPTKNLGIVTDYDFIGTAMQSETVEEEFIIYSDQAPDQGDPWSPYNGNGDWVEKVIIIIQPTNSSTVFANCEIRGISDASEKEIVIVEVQIDSTSSSGWHSAESDDDWYSWSYKWDTKAVADSIHTIHARCYDGEDYYYDSITVYVDQVTATAPKTTTMEKLAVGDRYEYRLVPNLANSDMPEDTTVTGNMTVKVTAEDTVRLNGNDYEVYIMKMDGKMEMKSGGQSMTSTMSGTTWLLKNDLSIVKEEIKTESTTSSSSIFGSGSDYSSEEVITYSPPKQHYHFPLEVANKRESSAIKTVKSTVTEDGETDSNTYTEDITIKYECLRTDKITVPSGSFDTFLVHYTEDYGNGDGLESQYIDTDGDGWSDDEEEYYGTDPLNPEDSPSFEEEEENGDGSDGESKTEEDVNYYEESGEEFQQYSYQSYSIEYYSPEVGYYVKIEYYDYNRELETSFELVSYSHKKVNENPGSDDADGSGLQIAGGYEIPISVLLLLIIIIVIIIAVVIGLRRRRRRLDAQNQQQIVRSNIEEPEGRAIEVEPIELK